MNAEVIRILNGYGASTVEQIRQNLSSTGTNATGKSAQSLKYSVTSEGTKATLMVVGKPFFAVVETGRKPTPSYKPSVAFVKSIQEWMDAKGKTGSAYAIAQSIHKKGTKLFRDGGRSDIYSNVINQNLTDKISLDLLNQFAKIFMTNVVKLFRDGTDNFRAA
jgi:phage/plasmid primase-like uncharacterized protein